MAASSQRFWSPWNSGILLVHFAKGVTHQVASVGSPENFVWKHPISGFLRSSPPWQSRCQIQRLIKGPTVKIRPGKVTITIAMAGISPLSNNTSSNCYVRLPDEYKYNLPTFFAMKSWLVNGKFQPQWFVSVSDLTGPSCQLGKDTLECLSLDSSFQMFSAHYNLPRWWIGWGIRKKDSLSKWKVTKNCGPDPQMVSCRQNDSCSLGSNRFLFGPNGL